MGSEERSGYVSSLTRYTSTSPAAGFMHLYVDVLYSAAKITRRLGRDTALLFSYQTDLSRGKERLQDCAKKLNKKSCLTWKEVDERRLFPGCLSYGKSKHITFNVLFGVCNALSCSSVHGNGKSISATSDQS